MYKKPSRQATLTDFNQPLGLKLNPENRWIKKAATIPWDDIEEKYAKLFPSNTGMPAKPLRMALGSLIIQHDMDYRDRELVLQIQENPYLQYFIGLPGYQQEAPFAPSLLVEFRRRLSDDILSEINEMVISFNEGKNEKRKPGRPSKGKGTKNGNAADSKESHEEQPVNQGTLILDATCAPQNIAYPQDTNLLNEARENLEKMIRKLYRENGKKLPRMYAKQARKDYLRLAKCRKKTTKKIREAIRKQLQYIRRDRNYLDSILKEGAELPQKLAERLKTIDLLVEQQTYMYKNKCHSVPDRIVSLNQPYLRPIVRGKARADVEFGAKFDMSIDEKGLARIEKLSFNAYNESEVLIPAVEQYKARTGHYPERVLVDKIYRNRNNRAYCKEHVIRLQGPNLGRPKGKPDASEKRTEYIDNKDRIEVERGFSLAKRCYGLGLIRTKCEDTTRSSIALSVLAMNVEKLMAFLRTIFWTIISRYKWCLSTEFMLTAPN